MRCWFNTAAKLIPKFNPCVYNKRGLSQLLQYVGVFSSSISDEDVLTVNVPRYVFFLTRMTKLPKVIASGIRQLAIEHPTSKDHFRLLSPSADYLAHYRIRFLTYMVVKDLFITDHVPEVETANIRDTILDRFEKNNLFIYNERLSVDCWLFGVSILKLSREFASRAKYVSADMHKKPSDTATRPKGRSTISNKNLYRVITSFPSDIGDHDFEIKVLRNKAETFFGLPWNYLYEIYGVFPPHPDYVYSNKQVPAEDRGMYFHFWDAVNERVNSADYVQKAVPDGLTKERQLLKPFVQVYAGTPYMFHYRGLFDYYTKPNPKNDPALGVVSSAVNLNAAIPNLLPFLKELASLTRYELKERAFKPPVKSRMSNEQFIQQQIAKSVATREANKHRLLENKSWSPKDPRVRFTPFEDDTLCEFYRPGMTEETRVAIERVCAGHSWDTIVIHARLLCNKMMDAGVTDPTKLPYIRATPRIKKLIEEMNR
jgi:hypothetical protein